MIFLHLLKILLHQLKIALQLSLRANNKSKMFTHKF